MLLSSSGLERLLLMLQKLLEKFLIVCLLLLSKEKGPEIGSSPPSKVS